MNSSTPPPSLTGTRVFVVEDEALVAINIESMLEDLGCNVIGPVMRFDHAEKMLAGDFSADVAILDVNLGGSAAYPLALRLSELGVPLIFATGYGKSGIPDEWHDRPILQKPYTAEEVADGLAQALKQG